MKTGFRTCKFFVIRKIHKMNPENLINYRGDFPDFFVEKSYYSYYFYGKMIMFVNSIKCNISYE